jgi:hypothetical protein
MIGCERTHAPGPDKAEKPPEQTEKAGNQTEKADKAPAGGVTENDRTAAAPISKDKWDVSHAEKTWGVRLKGFKYIEEAGLPNEKDDGRALSYQLLLEFTKDLEGPDLWAVKGWFASSSPPSPHALEFVVIDLDGVPVAKVDWGVTYKGDVTGVKGDAFWLIIPDAFRHLKGLEDVKRVKRVELRPKRA